MNRAIIMAVGLCLVLTCGPALAKEKKPSRRPIIVEDSQDIFGDLYVPSGAIGIAGLDTTWLGAIPPYGPGDVGPGGVWDFDDDGTLECPNEDGYVEYLKNHYPQGPLPRLRNAQYWTSEDVYAQKGLYWHAEDFTDPAFSGMVSPITGTYSAWCGRVTVGPDECFNDAPGYGHNWSQWLCRTVTLDDTNPMLTYLFRSDTEPDFDYCYVIIDAEFPDSNGWVGDDADTLRCYDGSHLTTFESIDLSTWSSDPDMCDEIVVDGDYSGDYVKICFLVVSDAAWDDEDAIYPTVSGAFTVDDINLESDHGFIYSNFETGTLEGWEAGGGWSSGDFTAIRDKHSFPNADPCYFDDCDMDYCVLTFYDPTIGAAGGYPANKTGHHWNRAWSPAINLTPYTAQGFTMSFDVYKNLPVAAMIFYRHDVSYVQNLSCPTGAWSPPVTDGLLYYSATPQCIPETWDFTHLVPADASSLKVAVSVLSGCLWLGGLPCPVGNASPAFDNVRVGVIGPGDPPDPPWPPEVLPVDLYADAFPYNPAWPAGASSPGSSGHEALIDRAFNLSNDGAFLRLGDTLVVSMDEPNSYLDLCFRIIPGPETDLADPFFTTWFPDTWEPCNTSEVHCARMDTAFLAGTGQVTEEGYYASMFHEDDPRYGVVGGEGVDILPDSLFTPGTQIYYYLRASFLPGPGPYNNVPPAADPDDLSTLFEVSVLPDMCKDPRACLLYVDYFNRGAQRPIENALAALGRTWDRFDMSPETSYEGCGIGNRFLGAGRYRLRDPIGPSLDHLAQYGVILINTGTLPAGSLFSDGGTGLYKDPTNDIMFLSDWINESDLRGLWLNGSDIANELATTSPGPKSAFLGTTLGASLVASSYRDFVGHAPQGESCRELRTTYGGAAKDNYYDTWDVVRLKGSGCPELHDYDVIEESGSGGGIGGFALLYDRTDVGYPPDGLCASMDHVFSPTAMPFDTVRTKIDGFSLHMLRDYPEDCTGATSIALWLRDVLGGYRPDEQGFFSDTDFAIQYCPPQNVDTVTGVEGGAGRKYANALFQNYPNPFRGAQGTTINYSVAKAGAVRVRIFDAAGRLINTIADQAKPGENSIVWDGATDDGSKVASGVYFYEIWLDGYKAQKKMIIAD